jgi:hypothetical protein
MNVFIPVWEKPAAYIDNQRLNKQITEAYQILNILLWPSDRTKGWKNHPAVRMWRGYAEGLGMLLLHYCQEWIEVRGRGHKVREYVLSVGRTGTTYGPPSTPWDPSIVREHSPWVGYKGPWTHSPYMPRWWGYEPIASSCRASLLYKARYQDAPKYAQKLQERYNTLPFYSAFGWQEKPVYGYVWPVDKNLELLSEIQEWRNSNE